MKKIWKPPKGVNTLRHFERWARQAKLDNGRWFKLEEFQRQVVADILAGVREVWMVVPEGNGKTTLMAIVALYHAAHTETAFVPIGAASREQAEIMYRQAEAIVLRSPKLWPQFICQEGYRRIKHVDSGGRIQVFAADDRTADGVIPTLAFLDELHRHRNLKLYRTWTGKLDKRGGQIVTISTAGEPGSEFEDTRDRIRKSGIRSNTTGKYGCYLRVENEGLVLHDWSVPDRKLVGDLRVVAEANPRRSITQTSLRRKRSSPTMTDDYWDRFVCNIATRAAGQAVKPEEWDRMADPGVEPDRDVWTIGWMDLGWKIDTSAIGTITWEGLERRVIKLNRIVKPPVDESDIVVALLEIQAEFPELKGIAYDPNAGAQQMVQLLEKGQHPLQTNDELREEKGLPPLGGEEPEPLVFIEHSQDNAPMSLAARRFEEAVRKSWFVHDGDPGMRSHVLNAVKKPLGGDRFRYDRPPDAQGAKRKAYPIDALTGLLFGNSVAVAEKTLKDPPLDPEKYIPNFV